MNIILKNNLNYDNISDMYKNGNSLRKIGLEYNVDPSTIKNFLIKNNFNFDNIINYRKKSDTNFFEKIDNNTKAYILGLICSDGCIHNGELSFTSKDIKMVNDFKEILKSEHKINTSITYNKKTNKEYICYRIAITSKKIIKDLLELGITDNKSFTCKMPNIEDIYFWDFLRGLFDGDGCVSNTTNGRLRIDFIASEDIMMKIKIEFNKLNISNNKLAIVAKNKYGVIYRLAQYKKNDILLIRENMYKSINIDNPYYLDRKYIKIQKL